MTLPTFRIYAGGAVIERQYRDMAEAAADWPNAWRIENMDEAPGGFW